MTKEIAVGPIETRYEMIPLEEAMIEASVDLSFGVGSLSIGSTHEELFVGEFKSNVEKLLPTIEQKESDQVVSLRIKPERSVGNIVGNVKNEWDMLFSNQIPYSFNINLGVGDNILNFSDMQLLDLEIKTGVGDTEIDLSNIQKSSFDVDIKSGVGNTTIIVPKDMTVTIDAKKGIGSITYEGLEKKGSRYETDVVSDECLSISINLGIGDMTIKAK